MSTVRSDDSKAIARKQNTPIEIHAKREHFALLNQVKPGAAFLAESAFMLRPALAQ